MTQEEKIKEWSEDDDNMLDAIIEEYEARAYDAKEGSYLKDDCWEKANWLKSIKSRIQLK